MLDGVYDVHCDELPIGVVRRAGLVLPGVLPPARSVVFDAGSGRFTRSAFLESAGCAGAQLVALAPGGDRVALCARGRVGVHAWGTDRIWWSGPDPAEPRVPRDSDPTDHLAAFSPDGRALAVLATSMVDDGRVPFEDDEGSLAVVSVIDLVTGRRRRLWSGVGGWSAESAVGWSPGGDLMAATYLVPPEPADEDYVATVSATSTTSS